MAISFGGKACGFGVRLRWEFGERAFLSVTVTRW
jgi:hypothetical protein